MTTVYNGGMSNLAPYISPALELAPGGFANRTAIDAIRYMTEVPAALAVNYAAAEDGTAVSVHRSFLADERGLPLLATLIEDVMTSGIGERVNIR